MVGSIACRVMGVICALLLMAAADTALAQGAGAQRRAPASQATKPARTPRPDNSDRGRTEQARRLAAFGISSEAGDLVAFLENGFPAQTDLSRLPEQPAERSQLAVDAMAELGRQRAREAVPVLSSIATLQFPPGVTRLMEMDLARTAPESRNLFRDRAAQLLRYNAVNALGLIGDPASIEAVRQAFASEINTNARIQFSLALACLGDPSAMDFIVKVIQEGQRKEAAAAAKVFYLTTGQDFGLGPYTAARRRASLARQYRDWWRANRGRFRPDPAAVLARRMQPDTPVAFEPRTTRDLLKMASYYFDFENRMQSRDARARLAAAGKSINRDLERIAQDENEDINIRMEALNWYYEANRADSRKLLRSLRNSADPEVADKAQSLLELIELPGGGNR